MVFSNLIFLYLFLPVCLIFYFLCQNIRAKNAVLIVFSLIFYAWGEPVYLLLMIASVAVNWGFGLLIERRRKKVFLILALVLDLGCLAVFKYAGFFVENLNALFRISLTVPQIPLPIGISFSFGPLAAAAGYVLAAAYGYRQLDGMSGDISGFALTLGELAGVAVWALGR